MKKNRLIPVLLLKNGQLVKSKSFQRYQNIGNPVTAVKRLSEWGSDELIYLDITKQGQYDLNRDDLAFSNRTEIIDIVADVAAMTLMPITVGGGIRSLKDIETRLKAGADKVCVNTQALQEPSFISDASKEFGSQCIVVSIDYKYIDSTAYVYDHHDKTLSDIPVIDWLKQIEQLGAGEVLVTSMELDGKLSGYDVVGIENFASKIKIPLIACSGAGEWQHMLEVFTRTKADAVAAANIFHYYDQSVYLAKKYLYENGANVRNADLLEIITRKSEHALL